MGSKEIFKKPLEHLTKISALLKDNQKNMKSLTPEAKKFETALGGVIQKLKSMESVAKGVGRVMRSIFDMVKSITLASMVSGTLLGIRGKLAQKSVAEANDLGLSSKNKSALEYAGEQAGRGGDFFKDILKEIRASLLSHEDAGKFATLGIDANALRNKDSMEQLRAVLEAGQKYRGDFRVLEEALQGIAGISQNTLKNIDLTQFSKDFQEGLSTFGGYDATLQSMGVGFNRVLANLKNIIDQISASLAPSVEQIFNNIAKGIQALSKDGTFNSMLEKLGQTFASMSEGFGEAIKSFVSDLPEILKQMQVVFYKIIEGLSYTMGIFTFGKTSKSAYATSESFEKKGDYARMDLLKMQMDKIEGGSRGSLANNADYREMGEEYQSLVKKYNLGAQEKYAKEIGEFNNRIEVSVSVSDDRRATAAEVISHTANQGRSR